MSSIAFNPLAELGHEISPIDQTCGLALRYLRLAAIARIRSAVKSSAGKNVSSASSDSVISTGVPKIMVVEIKLNTSPSSRILQRIATLSDDSGADRAGIG